MLSAGILVNLSFGKINAEDTNVEKIAAPLNFKHWNKIFPDAGSQQREIQIEKSFLQESVLYPFTLSDGIFGLALNATIELNSQNSLVRVILVDHDLQEFIVYEAYPLIADKTIFSIKDACEETCLLNSKRPYFIKIDLIEAAINIDRFSFSDTSTQTENGIKLLRKDIKAAQDDVKLDKIKNKIRINNLGWIAGKTSISQMTYEEKKKFFGGDKVPNLQGAEFYRGGIFEIHSEEFPLPSSASNDSSLVESFDWRNRHGADNPESPYYDGDPTGSGWITPVKRQRCNHCWAFSPVHATEAYVNLYFNQHLDLDLSEQDAASCSGGNIGCCDGGYINKAINHIIYTGILDESCFPYSGSCESCGNKCGAPRDLIKIGGKRNPGYYEEDLKKAVIENGPITCGIRSWWHFMVLVGFDIDRDTGETVWIFKNSWGVDWGEKGYGYLKLQLNDLYGKYILLPPVTSLVTSYEIGCYDRDGDGYYNWGIAHEKPYSCPESASEKDCDDSNPSLGPFDSNGHCIAIIDLCECDFAPSDTDVDGSDLAVYIINNMSISLIDLAADFGRVNCP